MKLLFDRLVYSTIARVDWLFQLARYGNSAAVQMLYHRRMERAMGQAFLHGTIDGTPAQIRPVAADDLPALANMFAGIPADHLRFFRPHALDERSLKQAVQSPSVLTYALFLDNEPIAYCILKLFAAGRAYLGRVVRPDLSGRGIGRFLSRFLYWQSHELGLPVYGTMHRDNIASARSHTVVRPFTIVAELPPGRGGGGYRLIHFHHLDEDAIPPVLRLELKQRVKRPTDPQPSLPHGDLQPACAV